MSGTDTSRTTLFADFAGRRRKFRLPLGQIEELERLCNAGVGEIFIRVVSMRFRAADIRETVRLGLEGGGMPEPEATALAIHYLEDAPLADHAQLAADILTAAISGVPDVGKETAEGSDDPATSPPLSVPEPQSASALATSET